MVGKPIGERDAVVDSGGKDVVLSDEGTLPGPVPEEISDAERQSVQFAMEKGARELVAAELDLAETHRRLLESNLKITEAQLELAERQLDQLVAENEQLRRENEVLKCRAVNPPPGEPN